MAVKNVRRRLLWILLSPLLLLVILLSLLVGLNAYGGPQLDAQALVQDQGLEPAEAALVVSLLRCLVLPLQVVFILMLFGGALLVRRYSFQIAGFLLNVFFLRGWLPATRPIQPEVETASPGVQVFPKEDVAAPGERLALQHLVASAVTFTALFAALVFSLAQFFGLANLAVLVTIVTGGLAWGARTLISDLLSGASNIFENVFDVGDKVQLIYLGEKVEGIVEKVTVRLAVIRSVTGELYYIPHGELRILRNFSRGSYSGTSVTFRVPAAQVDRAIALFEALAPQSPELLPDLLEPWLVISSEGELSEHAELTLISKAPFGQGADLRLQLMTLVQQQLAEHDIQLVD